MRTLIMFFLSILTYALPAGAAKTFDLAKEGVVVKIADLEIDPVQLEAFKTAVKDEMEAAVRLEPGVISIYAVALKDKPSHIRFLEIYKNEEAYLSHRETPHFKKYLATTKAMIKSRQLLDGVPVQLNGKMQ